MRVGTLTPIFDLAAHRMENNARDAIASSLDALVAAVNNTQEHCTSIIAEARANPSTIEAVRISSSESSRIRS